MEGKSDPGFFLGLEYFRRLLCDIIGDWVEKGEAPYDLELLGGIVKRISYENARQYFKFDRANQLKHHPNKMT